jgi:hypothetical protein
MNKRRRFKQKRRRLARRRMPPTAIWLSTYNFAGKDLKDSEGKVWATELFGFKMQFHPDAFSLVFPEDKPDVWFPKNLKS